MFNNSRRGKYIMGWARYLVERTRGSNMKPSTSQGNDYLMQLHQSAAASQAQVVEPKLEDGEMTDQTYHNFYNQIAERRQAQYGGYDVRQGMGQQGQQQYGPPNRGGPGPVPYNNNNNNNSRCSQDRKDNERYYPTRKRPHSYPDSPHNKRPRNDVRHSYPGERGSRDSSHERLGRSETYHPPPSRRTSRDSNLDWPDRGESRQGYPRRRDSRDSSHESQSRNDAHYSHAYRRDSSHDNQSKIDNHQYPGDVRDFQAEGSMNNDGSWCVDYFHDLIQYVHDRYPREDRPPSHTPRYRPPIHNGRDSNRSRSSPSQWDVKKQESESDTGISSNDQSDSENEVFSANQLSSDVRQSNNDSLPSTSGVKSSFQTSHPACTITKSPTETQQSTFDNSIVVEASPANTNVDNSISLTDGLLSLPIINRSTDKRLSPIVYASNDVAPSSSFACESATPPSTKIEPSTDSSVMSELNASAPPTPKVESIDILATPPSTKREPSSYFSPASPGFELSHSSVTPPRSEMRSNTDFSLVSHDIDLNRSSVTPPRSEIRPTTDFFPDSLDIKLDHSSPSRSERRPSNEFSPDSPDIKLDHLSVTPSRSERRPSTNFSPDSPDIKLDYSSVTPPRSERRPSTDFSPASPDIELIHTSVTPIKSKNHTNTDFSPASPDLDFLHTLVTPPRSRNVSFTDVSSGSPDIEILHPSATPPNSRNEPSRDKRSVSPDIEFVDSPASPSNTKNKSGTGSSSPSPDIQFIGSSTTQANTKNERKTPPIKILDFVDLTEDEPSTELPPAQPVIVTIDVSTAQTNPKLAPTNVTTPSATDDLNDLLETLTGNESLPDQINSSFKNNDQPAAAVPYSNREQKNPKTDASASHRNIGVRTQEDQELSRKRSIDAKSTSRHNVDVRAKEQLNRKRSIDAASTSHSNGDIQAKENQHLNRKRSIDAASMSHCNVNIQMKEDQKLNRKQSIVEGVTAQSSDENSSAAAYHTRPPFPSNSLSKRSTNHIAIQETVNQEKKKSQEFVATVQHDENRPDHLITKSIESVSLNVDRYVQNRAKEQNAGTAYSLALPLNQVLHAMSTQTDKMIKPSSPKATTSNESNQQQNQATIQTTLRSEPSQPIATCSAQIQQQISNLSTVASKQYLPVSSVSKQNSNQVKPQPAVSRELSFPTSKQRAVVIIEPLPQQTLSTKNTQQHVSKPSTSSGHSTAPTTSDQNRTTARNDLEDTAASTSKEVPASPVNLGNNENVREKRKSETDCHTKTVNKKLKLSVHDSIFIKNTVKQFKVILKIVDTRRSGWAIRYMDDWVEDNICDNIYYFEKLSSPEPPICCLSEVKFFDKTSKANKINYKNLFGGEFNIKKYFSIFCKYENTAFSNPQSKLSIHTNRDLDEDLFKSNGIEIAYEKGNCTLRIKKHYEKSKIYNRCLEYFDLPKLADLLNEFVHGTKTPHMKMDLLRKYHIAMINEKVLQMSEVWEKGKTKTKAKFHSVFVKGAGLSNAAKKLREHLINRYNCIPKEASDAKEFPVRGIEFGEMRYEETVDRLPFEKCQQKFEDFFKVFTITRINERDIEEWVKKLGKDFVKLEDEDYSCAVQNEFSISLKNEGLKPDIFERLQQTISKLIVTEQQQAAPQYDIEFKQATFTSLSQVVKPGKIILCSTESLLLSELKIRQFSKKLGYTESKESLFINDEVLYQKTGDVVNALAQRMTNLLVIVWENKIVPSAALTKLIGDIIQRLRDAMSQTSKSVIIVADRSNAHLSLPQYQFIRIEEELTLDIHHDLSKSTKVILQGRTLTLGDLADDTAVNKFLRNPKVLETLLLTQKVEVGHELVKPTGFEEKLYDLKLKQNVIIDSKIFQEKMDDVFLIRKISCESFTRDYKPLPSERVFYVPNSQPNSYNVPPNARFILLDRKVKPKDVINSIQGKTVHQFIYESNSFIWKSTIGSSTSLIKYKVTDNNELCRSTTIDAIMFKDGPKTIIVSGESGSGKSVCLYEFAKLASKLYQTKSDATWILQVSLKKPLKHTLKGYAIESSDDAIHFLADYLDFEDEQKELFVMSAQGQLKLKLILFIDDYDDMFEDVDQMTSMLQHLQNSDVQKMFIASKSNVLEEAMGIFSYSLQFTSEEKSQFVTKFFGGKPPEIDFSKKAKLLNTPLHLKMFAELCHKKPEKKSIDNHFDLYKSYVNLYLPTSQLDNAYKLSAQKMLTDIELEEIGATIENVDFELPGELSRKSVMEYLTAKWLSKRHLSTKRCINNLIERTTPIFLSVYLAAYQNEKKNHVSINEYAENGFLSFLKAMMKLDGSSKPCLRRLIRKGKNNTLEVLKFLLDHCNDTNCHEFVERSKYPKSKLVKYVNKRVDDQTPLQAAVECEKIDLACELILKGADVSVLTRSSDFTTNLAIYATEQLANGNTRLGPVAVMSLEKSPQAAAHLDNGTQFPNVLSYLFSRGHARLVEDLLKVRNNCERRQLLESTIDGNSLLDLVNQSSYIEDDDRLFLISYLEQNSLSNLLQTHRDSILRFACLAGHERTFNYFLYPPETTSIQVLASALRCNDLRVIEFLMHDSKRTIDEKGNTALHQAVALGVSRKTINYLLGKVGINDTNNFGQTALHLAFEHGASLLTIQFLINSGASLSATDNLGFPTWIHALHTKNTNNHTTKEESSRCYCKTQQRELLTFLVQTKRIKPPSGRGKSHVYDETMKAVQPKLAYFANPDDYDLDYNQGESRLHAALTSRDEDDWCKFLIIYGADVNIEKDGIPAFHVALNNGRYDVAKLMLQHGVVIDKEDKSGQTPMDYLKNRASNCERQKMLDILDEANKIFADPCELQAVKSVDPSNVPASSLRFLLNCRNKSGKTILHQAAFSGQFDVIDYLYKLSIAYQDLYKDFEPIDVNAVDIDGNSPLHLAAKQDKPKAVEKLLSIGARFCMKNFNDMVPMALSRQGSDARKLLQATVDLFKSVEDQNLNLMVSVLKKYPAVQNARDEEGKTPLFLVKNDEMMKYLLTDVNVLDIHGRSPMYYAAEEDNWELVKLLLNAGGIYEFEGFKDGRNKTYELLQKINAMFKDMHSHEPRFFVEGNPWALDKKLDDMANSFGIARDIIVNTKDKQKNTLLHYAAKYDYVDVVENLLKNGAIYNSRNKYQKTPANLAVSSKKLFESIDNWFVKLEVTTWMDVDSGIVANCRMSGGYTLLLRAAQKGNYEAVKWLVNQGADTKATGNNGVGFRLDRQKYPKIAALMVN